MKLGNKSVLIGAGIGFLAGFLAFDVRINTKLTWSLDVGQLIVGGITAGFNAGIILLVTHNMQNRFLDKSRNGKEHNDK